MESVCSISRLREWRTEQGLTLEETADLTGLTASSISRMERGLIAARPATKVQMARALGVPASNLFEPPVNR